MIALLRLIRLPNLVIVALTQWLLYNRILLPAFQTQQIAPTLPPEQFYWFIVVTVLITAGGYIINDLVDIRIDLVNKPNRVIIGRRIATATAYWFYFCINLTGFLLATYLAFVGNRVSLLFIFPTAVVGLLIYSIFLKKRPLSGNVLIALYCAGVALIVWLAEQPSLAQLSPAALTRITQLLTYYAVFAFFSTLFREIIKDLEDQPGDAANGARTLPIVWGALAAKRLAGASALSLLLYLVYFAYLQFASLVYSGKIALLILMLLLLLALGLLLRAHETRHYHRLSQLTKVIMLWGILLLLFF
ncbi:MAG: geranylgeranylglycerol-phosphate geranylgeranyltransferase [Saprospiraceae bacterium]